MVDGAEDQADPLVPERGQVAPGLLDGDRVVARDAREVQPLDGGVDQDDRDVALGELPVVLVRRVGLREETAA